MKQQVTQTLWTCDYHKCKTHITSYDDRDTPPGWTTISGAMQNSSGGGPAEFDLCPRHTKTFHTTYTVHTDLEEDD